VTNPLILLSNDDGIDSPGLLALARALDPLGDLLIVAPRHQQTSMGRAMPIENDGRLFKTHIGTGKKRWEAYAAHASPAQAVQHALLELAGRKPDMAAIGVNYGENVGVSITISGTVCAALEAAAHGIPSLAVSLEVPHVEQHRSNDPTVDFSAAGHFARQFAERLLAEQMPPDVDVLKVEVPGGATPDTPWRVTRLEHRPYFRPLAPNRARLGDVGPIGYELVAHENLADDSDAAAIVNGVVSVTPLSIDMTSRVDLASLRGLLAGDQP
jgi:5'-nucleotidase